MYYTTYHLPPTTITTNYHLLEPRRPHGALCGLCTFPGYAPSGRRTFRLDARFQAARRPDGALSQEFHLRCTTYHLLPIIYH